MVVAPLTKIFGWLVVLGLAALCDSIYLYRLYRAASQRGRKKREKIEERKMSKQTQPAPTASARGPCPTISRTPRH